MNDITTASFDHPDLGAYLAGLTAAQLDDLDFGVIGIDDATTVQVYNRYESTIAGLSTSRVLGQALFTSVAPCMNNFLVAQRFEDAAGAAALLDDTIDYVLTLRMRPLKVKLRLLAIPGASLRYVLVQRRA
jgi:photoactive yellow protein